MLTGAKRVMSSALRTGDISTNFTHICHVFPSRRHSRMLCNLVGRKRIFTSRGLIGHIKNKLVTVHRFFVGAPRTGRVLGGYSSLRSVVRAISTVVFRRNAAFERETSFLLRSKRVSRRARSGFVIDM